MKLSTAKDKVLRFIVKTGSIKGLDIDEFLINAAIEDLAKEDYIENIEISGIGSGSIRKYVFSSIYPKGIYFVKSGKSFRRKAFWDWVSEFPKKYWYILALAASVGFNIKEIIKYFLGKR